MSSLAGQLAQSASLNTGLLVDRSRRKYAESYLFTGREADQHDLESIHALGVNGLLQLASLDSSLLPFEDKLFSDYSKSTDRTLLSSEANAELDTSIDACLALLGPFLMESPTGKVIEWLVRRFRIHEFNIEAILSLFLPYHESPHFAKMITILHLKQNSTWNFLLAFKSAAQNVPRMSLVTEMLRNSDVARFVTSLLPSSLKEGRCHRVLLAFNAACLHDFILRCKAFDEGTLAYLLPALLEPLQHLPVIKDAILGSYILLSSLSQKCQFKGAALKAIVGGMTACAQHVSPRQYTNAVLPVCEPQTEVERWSDSTVKVIIRIPAIHEELRNSCKWIGAEKLLCPLLPGLLKRLGDQNALSLLETLITAPQVPIVFIQRCANMLIRCVISEEAVIEAPIARRLLSVIKQRYPNVFSEMADAVSEEGEDVRVSVEQLIMSLSMVSATHPTGAGGKGNVDMILALNDADAKVRAIAVRDILASLSKESIDLAEKDAIHSALLARVQDTNQTVIEALYNSPALISPILTTHAPEYITNLATALCSPTAKPKRTLLRAHLAFLGTHLFPTSAPYLDDVFHQILFPFLLFSKPRQHTAEVVWEVVSEYLKGVDVGKVAVYEWLVGCASIVGSEKKEGVDPVVRMSRVNLSIAAQIAKNILMSDNYAAHFDALVAKLQDNNPHSRILSNLVARALLGQLSGEHQLEAAHRVLNVTGIDQLAELEDLPSRTENLSDVIDDDTLGRTVVAKPSSRNTLHWLQISILALVPTIPRPQGLTINWMVDDFSASLDKRGPRYVELMRTIYRLANTSTSAPRLTMNLLQTLFVHLKDDALAFLAGIWINCIPEKNEENVLPTMALRHAEAFLEAHVTEDDGTDFQTVFPAFLVALQSRDVDVRQAALACISCLRRLADHRFTAVYKFDVIYGQNENQLQYLDRDDFQRYVVALVERQDHLAHDVDHVKLFHQQHLAPDKADKKRDAEYKHRVLCYILSHINALGAPSAQIALLKAVEAISDSAKAQILLPTIQRLLSTPTTIAKGSDSQRAELSDIVVSCLDISVTNDLNDEKHVLWDTFVAVLRGTLKSGLLSSSRRVISQTLEHGLFAKLRLERKIAICEALLDISSSDAEAYAACKRILSNLVQEVPLIVHMLDYLQPNPIGASPRASKRAKLVDAPEDALPRLSLFVEVLGTRPLPGSLDLISHLLETLNRVVQSVSPAQADVSYIEQLLMSAVEDSASKIKEMPNLSPSAVRLDILVELIRVADNPQTFHQALLLVASLARLAPDSVLRNVMPIFTFMGSNVFHRDDTYSFRVVQQTVDNIVPVMVSSLKRTHSEPLNLWIGSKDFLRVFTDAANHIPRHRRTSFFTHLVDVLGSEDFLPPICMLLIEKVANRVVRQTSEEVQNSLALPLSILHHSPSALQIGTLTEILRECQRLAALVSHPETVQATFLEAFIDNEHSAPLSTVLRRRAQALVIFVGYAVRPSTSESSAQGHMSHLVAALIALSALESSANTDTKVDEISHAARTSMDRALRVMSVVDFANAVLSMIESGEQRVQAGALDLLSQRLPDVSTKMRQDIVPTVIKIVAATRKLLVSTNDSLAPSAFRALRSIALTLCTGEESSLTETISPILTAIRERRSSSWALAAMSPLPSKLGPRMIPYFREIITLCISVLREGTTAGDAQSILLGLLSAIPSFWGTAELEQVITLYLDHSATASAPSAPMSSLMKSVAKRAPAKVILPAMTELWRSLKTSQQTDRIAAYLDLLTRTLRNATRPVVLEHVRPLFRVFLEAFDVAKVPSGTNTDAEHRAIAAFTEFVVKLNDAAFRPLFRRLYDWAFADNDDIARKISFCHLYASLLEFFKILMVPYMSFLLEPFTASLQAFSLGTADNQTFWTCLLETVSKSLSFDDGTFWRDDKLRQLASPLIEQVAVCIQSSFTEGRPLLLDCLSALVDSVTDDTLLKSINLNLLMHTRSDDVKVRILTLTCSAKLWRDHGGKLLGFLAETTTFIAECSEDENDLVVREAFKLKDAVESVAGSINAL